MGPGRIAASNGSFSSFREHAELVLKLGCSVDGTYLGLRLSARRLGVENALGLQLRGGGLGLAA